MGRTERAEKIIVLLICTLIFLLFLELEVLPAAEVLPSKRNISAPVLCERIADLIRVSDSTIHDLIRRDEDENDYVRLLDQRESALDAAEVLLLSMSLPVSSRGKVQDCMSLHDQSIDLFDPAKTLTLIEWLLFKAGEIKVRLEILLGPKPPEHAEMAGPR